MSSDNYPWSLKGVTQEAKDIARKMSEKSDATMGVWLSHVIRSVYEEELQPNVKNEKATASEPSIEDKKILERISTMERRTSDAVATLHKAVNVIGSKLERLQHEDDLDQKQSGVLPQTKRA